MVIGFVIGLTPKLGQQQPTTGFAMGLPEPGATGLILNRAQMPFSCSTRGLAGMYSAFGLYNLLQLENCLRRETK